MTALPAFDADQLFDVQAPDETPLDWPGPGPIDRAVHDLPHASSTLEWWYLNCHLVTREGREVSLFAAFFRERAGVDPETGAAIYAHSVAWALSEPDRARYHPKVAVDPRAPALGLAKLDAARHVSSGRIDRALREVLERGRVPGPTRLLDSPAVVSQSLLHLDYGRDRLVKIDADEYELSLYDELAEIGCSLRFVPRKNPVRYGSDGIVHGVQDERMFYYFIPRCDVRGQLTIDGSSVGVDQGSGW
ncbi:MAG TPA: lipocalin-like domain-containing protein, partial [Polyangiaceae bacterium]|nr:lipocalin-like domain-containing protein [Polyangiaceae bacterium]